MKSWVCRFLAGLLAFLSLNLLRLLVTSRAFQTDGMEEIGFPFVFFERGGFSYRESWDYRLLAVDIAIALGIATVFAHMLSGGVTSVFRRIQNPTMVDAGTSENLDQSSEDN